MPFCSKCGGAVEEDARFCASCGHPLSATPLDPDTARKTVTVVFSDITGSTSLAERLDAETVSNVLARYSNEMRCTLEAHGGTVAKFIGDAVMAVFGVPTVHEDDALRAVRAAADLGPALERLNVELEQRWGVRLQVRTGVNTGEVVAGDRTSEEGYVVGDAVNVAARLEQAAKPGEVLLGQETYALLREAVTVEPVEPLTLKGKSEPVPAFRLADVVALSAAPEPRLEAPMVGRERELSQLVRAFELVRDEGRPQLVTILGPPGVGKSRLASELISSLQADARVLRGRCLSYGEGITYWPLAEVVRDAAGIADEDTTEEALGKMGALLGSEDDRASIAGTVGGALGLSETSPPPEEILWAVRKLFEALALDGPLVLVLDDLHWGEPTFLSLLEYVVRSSESALLVLCLARPDLRESHPALATDEGNRSLISLQPLGERQSGELIRHLLGEVPLALEVSTRIIDAAGGNPLFVQEMLRMLVDEGALEREDGGWRVAGDLSELRVPPTVEAVLADRLDQLEAGHRDTIRRASVVGQEFWPEAVAELSHPALREKVPGHLKELARRGLVMPGGHPFAGGEAFKFSHGLVRDVAYRGLLKESRSELHGRFADWLEDKVGHAVTEYEAILGYHLEQAYRYREELGPVDDQARILARRAAERLASAGMRAAAAREDGAAVSFLSRASRLLPARAPERLRLLPIIGESLEGTANHARAGEIYAEAVEGAARVGDRGIEGRARLGRAQVNFVTDPTISPQESVAEVERVIAILEEVGDQQALVKAWRLMGEALFYQGRALEGQRALERGLKHLGPSVSPRNENATFFAMGMCLLDGPTPLAHAVAFSQERLRLARHNWRRSLEADMLHLLGIGEARRGRFKTGRQALTDSTAISEDLGLRYMAQWSRRSLGHLELLAEDPRAAEQALRWSYEVMDEMDLKGSLGEAAVPLADALLKQGRCDEATRVLEKVQDDWATGDASIEAPLLIVRAKLFLAEGRYDRAKRLAAQALRLVKTTDWACLQADILLAYGEVLLLADCTEDAISILRRALKVAKDKEYVVAARKAARYLEKLERSSVAISEAPLG
jgi:class 3 adenylate cyclase/tetratricopeptide (TPR) repeat protein